MKKLKAVGLSLLVLSQISRASTIAVVDSGNDFLHIDLAPKAWINPLEIAGNDRDEDRNGYQDDINGWNFAEGNSQLIDYSYSYSLTPDSKRFFDIQLKSFLGTLTEEDRSWYKEKIKDETFIKNLQVFGNWMHGTHVTGITLKGNSQAKAVGIKLIPTEVKLPGKNALLIATKNQRPEKFVFDTNSEKGNIKDTLLMAALSALAKQQSAVFSEIGAYINGTKADVMNGSFGTPYSAIEGIIKTIFSKLNKREATKEELIKYTSYFFSVQLEETKKFLNAAPNTLFVFAAGNEGTNNDEYPTSPANVQGDNKITVAATLADQSIANFSNYGTANVEVAAPGVGIMSTIPMDQHMAVSGTSQAAPYVANIAAAVKDVNPTLKVADIKKIILSTVDVKSWLQGKVKTSGLVNKARAMRAAELSKTMNLTAAISQSKIDILAKTENEVLADRPLVQSDLPLVLPMLNPIIIK
jgi:subtilisin family serine protease